MTWFALCGVVRADPVEIIVRLDTAREVNGVSIVPDGLFGVTAPITDPRLPPTSGGNRC